jgi:hypothetical protein
VESLVRLTSFIRIACFAENYLLELLNAANLNIWNKEVSCTKPPSSKRVPCLCVPHFTYGQILDECIKEGLETERFVMEETPDDEVDDQDRNLQNTEQHCPTRGNLLQFFFLRH